MQKRFHDIGSIISFYENRQNVSSKFLSRYELYSFSLRDGDPIIQSLCLRYHFSKCWPLLLDMPCLTFVQFIQFKNVKNTDGGMLLLVTLLQPATLLKGALLLGCFSYFLDCTTGTKSRNPYI